LALLGRKLAVTKERGKALALDDGSLGMLTLHPAYLLRLPDRAAQAEARRAFVEDLTAARRLIG
ncbi:MAG: uracil-DNA glycosylase, partial [Brevundimonas sp.]